MAGPAGQFPRPSPVGGPMSISKRVVSATRRERTLVSRVSCSQLRKSWGPSPRVFLLTCYVKKMSMSSCMYTPGYKRLCMEVWGIIAEFITEGLFQPIFCGTMAIVGRPSHGWRKIDAHSSCRTDSPLQLTVAAYHWSPTKHVPDAAFPHLAKARNFYFV